MNLGKGRREKSASLLIGSRIGLDAQLTQCLRRQSLLG